MPKELREKVPNSDVCRTAYHVRSPISSAVFLKRRKRMLPQRYRKAPIVPSQSSSSFFNTPYLNTHHNPDLQVNLAFLAVQYGVLALALLVSAMCAYAWWNRPRRGGPRVYIP